MNRREACRLLAAAVAAPSLVLAEEAKPMLSRAISSSGELVPVVGMGSSGTFDVGATAAELEPLRAVLSALVEGGGRVIDTSPMYGRAESVLGELIAGLGLRERLWLATKVWTRGRQAGADQIADSMRRLRTDRLELVQVHNLLDWREHVPTLRSLQQSGKVKYVGVTHYRADAHADLERVLNEERFDWLQVNYSLAERGAETRLLPFCRDRGVAVMINRPFADGGMFAHVKDRALPDWASEIGCTSWAQFFLKFVVSHPAVTCVIPATAKARHMQDDCAAGFGPLPDAGQRARMASYWDELTS
jgi:diketogulonate reductase-like aldo/keto reductase